jgi:hypothetical protein
MKRIILPLLLILLFAAAELPAFSGDKFGRPLTMTELTKVSEIEKDPKPFIGRKVLVSGTIVEVCAKRGCWMNIASDTPFEKIQIKVTDGVIVFPMSARGKSAYVEGVLEELKMSQGQAIAYGRHQAEESGTSFDPATITGAQVIYRIRALGAVISE